MLDGEGEAFISQDLEPAQRGSVSWFAYSEARVGVHLAKDDVASIAGTLYLKDSKGDAMRPVRFSLDLAELEIDAQAEFLKVKEDHYQTLLAQPIPGAAHFRHEMQEARQARLALAEGTEEEALTEQQRTWFYDSQLQKSFAFVTGGRALAENLPLDLELNVTTEETPTVALASIVGITVPEVDWKPLLPKERPAVDRLARYLPPDQYACFFPSFGAMLQVMDEATRIGTPVLVLTQPQAQDVHVRERYEKQLCLQIDEMTRLLGPTLIKSIAMTGSDPYFPTGTDVAVLFEATNPELLKRTLMAKQGLALQTVPGAKKTNIRIGGTVYSGVVTPDRRICSYVFEMGDTVVVTNSPFQIERLLEVQESEESLATLDEFAFFRSQYVLGDSEETAFLVATDAAIRRWASPQWRIGTSRRTRAAAHLSELITEYDDGLLAGEVTETALMEPLGVPAAHDVRITEDGPIDSVYGSLQFLTPIAELQMESVTEAEAQAYETFRNNYERRWRQNFDPIAARISLTDDQLGLGLTVLPLTMRSNYRWLMELTGDTQIPADAGDPHEEAIVHFVCALNPDSEPVQYANNFLMMVNPQASSSLTKWIGKSITLYLDEDPFIDAALEAEDTEEFLQDNVWQMPVAAAIDITSLPRATVFLTALRAYLDQVVPEMLLWEPRKHGEESYVAVRFRESTGSDITEEFRLYYQLSADRLTLSLSETVLQRSIDRTKARKLAADESGSGVEAPTPERLGDSFEVSVDQRVVDAVRALSDDSFSKTMQRRAWANLPILNEYRRLYPDRDPINVYEELWGVTLLCPGEGTFTWDAKFQTMRSTAYGHPGQPLEMDAYPAVIREIERAEFGMTFENAGLRAKAVLHRGGGE